MKSVYLGAAVAGAMLMSAAVQADVGVGVKGGTLGTGLELTAGLTESINARVGFNQFTYSTSGTESDIDYDVDFKLQNAAAILDWHPFKGAFRLSVGYVFNNNVIEMTGKPTGVNSFELNGNTYTLDGLDGEVAFTNGAYVGIGWGNAGKGKGFGVNFEIGAFYQGSPDFSLTARGDSLIVDDPTFKADLAREEADAQDDIAEYDWYPVVSLGISYTF